MAEANKQMKLIGIWSPPGAHSSGWRLPAADTEDMYSFAKLKDVAQMAEAGKMDALFLADNVHLPTAALVERNDPASEDYSRAVRLDAMTTISTIAAVTDRLGVIATSSSTFNNPYDLARALASVDCLSEGRAGWNLVTTQSDAAAVNYGLDEHMKHGDRYARAEEFFDVCAGLWDCWDNGALVIDKATGRYTDVAKIDVLNHEGEHFKVKGPLNVPRSPQGRPVIAQAGASEPGRALAARIADLVFLASSTPEETKAFRDDIRTRTELAGRSPDHVKVMPGLMPIIGRTEEEARQHYLELQELITDAQGLAAMSRLTVGVDLTKYPMDGPMPDVPPTNGATTRQKIVLDWAKKENLTLRQVARRFAEADGHHLVWGTPEKIADLMEDWFRSDACDGFCILFPYYRRGINDFVTLVIPELQKRGLFRTEYEGRTLREHLGLPIPQKASTSR